MKRSRLPLTALRSFEAAGRIGSFTLASQELFVSQAAISRQIRDLEKLVGCPLFSRRHRGVDLTPAGSRLLEVLSRSFDDIEDCLSQIGDPKQGVELRVSVEPSFASCWLVPNLPAFQEAHPDIDVSVDSDTRLIGFRGGEPELAIRHSSHRSSWPRCESRRLGAVDMMPVIAASALAAGSPISQPADLRQHTLLHEENRDVWRRWFEETGMGESEPARGPVFADSGLVLQAVLLGQGIGLLDRLCIEDHIGAGRLVPLFGQSIANGAYWLVARRFDRLSLSAKRFVAWITARLNGEA